MSASARQWITRLAIALAVAAALWFSWLQYQRPAQNGALASGNGRVEGVEVDIAAKSAGRVREILVQEGEMVQPGQVLARMDTDVLEAQLHQAEAQLRQARSELETAHSQLALREAEKAATQASLVQREAERDAAQKKLERSQQLAKEGACSLQELDDYAALVKGAMAAVSAVQAQIVAAEAAITAARAQIVGAESAVQAAEAQIELIRADLADAELKAPRPGRVQYLIAQPGEVVAGGGRVLNLVDVTDLYMTFFLSTADAGKLALGSEVRLVLDAAPEYVFPAEISFVSDVAQFTPKTVETRQEREKLMFRIRAKISPELLQMHLAHAKTGLPGMAYVRLDPAVPWPEHLALKVPQ